MNKKESISLVTMLALGGLYLIWGSTFLSVRILLGFLPPLVISFSRNLVAGILFLVWSILGGHWKKLPLEHWKVHLLAGFLLITLGNGFMALAGQTIPSGLSSVFMAVGPLLLIIFFWISGRKPTNRKLLGTLIGFVGIILLASQKNLAIPGKEIDFYRGMGFLLIAVVAWNLYSIFEGEYVSLYAGLWDSDDNGWSYIAWNSFISRRRTICSCFRIAFESYVCIYLFGAHWFNGRFWIIWLFI
jgi:drug/metabolite transporter (DMT)-like permease